MTSSLSEAEQINQVRAQLASLPEGPVRDALLATLRNLESAAQQKEASSNGATQQPSATSLLLPTTQRRLAGLSSSSPLLRNAEAPSMIATKPALAVALLVHCLLLEVGFVCEGDGSGGNTPSGGESKALPGFAPAKRDLPPSYLVPDSWLFASSSGSDSADGTSATAAYRFEGLPTALSAEAISCLAAVDASLKSRLADGSAVRKGSKITIACLQVGEGAVILQSSAGTGGASIEVNTSRLLRVAGASSSSSSSGGSGTGSRSGATVDALKAALVSSVLGEGEKEKKLIQAVLGELLRPITSIATTSTAAASSVAAPSSSSSSSASSSSSSSKEPPANPLMVGQPRRSPRHHESNYDDEDDYVRGGFPRFGGGGFGGGGGVYPSPPLGIGRDDLMPSFGGAVPGGLFGGGGGGLGGGFGGGGGGMLFGPDHPAFRGGGGGGFGGGHGFAPPHPFPSGIPAGVPPGARFDPFGPPGVGEPGEPFRGGGRGGGLIPGLPAPDHLAPPPNEDGSRGDAGLAIPSQPQPQQPPPQQQEGQPGVGTAPAPPAVPPAPVPPPPPSPPFDFYS